MILEHQQLREATLTSARILSGQLKRLSEYERLPDMALTRVLWLVSELERTQPRKTPPEPEKRDSEAAVRREEALRSLSGDGILRTVTELNEARRREMEC